MVWFKKLYGLIGAKFGFGKTQPRKNNVADMSEAAKLQALEEARFLHHRFAVEVRALAEGEVPKEPQKAID